MHLSANYLCDVLIWNDQCSVFKDINIDFKRKLKVFSICINQQEKMPNGIMDGFFRKVNQKVNLGQCSTGHNYFIGRIFEKLIQK